MAPTGDTLGRQGVPGAGPGRAARALHTQAAGRMGAGPAPGISLGLGPGPGLG